MKCLFKMKKISRFHRKKTTHSLRDKAQDLRWETKKKYIHADLTQKFQRHMIKTLSSYIIENVCSYVCVYDVNATKTVGVSI